MTALGHSEVSALLDFFQPLPQEDSMKLLPVLLLCTLAVGCGYGSNYNGGGDRGSAANITALNANSQTAGTAFTLTLDGTNLSTGAVLYSGTTPLATTSAGD